MPRTRIEEVQSAWSDWPTIPAVEMEHYLGGAIDHDPTLAQEVLEVSSLDCKPFDPMLIWFAEAGLYQRVCGCACYQLATLLETGSCEVPDLIAFIAFDLAFKKDDFEHLKARQESMSLDQMNMLAKLISEFVDLNLSQGLLELDTEYAPWSSEEILQMAQSAANVERTLIELRQGTSG